MFKAEGKLPEAGIILTGHKYNEYFFEAVQGEIDQFLLK